MDRPVSPGGRRRGYQFPDGIGRPSIFALLVNNPGIQWSASIIECPVCSGNSVFNCSISWDTPQRIPELS